MEWRCKWCEKPHEENDPPCDNCGHGEFEKAVVPMSPERTDESTPLVWACTECGREHQKNSPPCSRCGNAMLEQREVDYGDVEDMGSTGWSDILDRKYTAGFALVGVLGLVLGLGMVGVIDLPGVGGPPSPPDAPGENETANGLSLADTEGAFVGSVNTRRENAGVGALEYGKTVDAMATFYNKRVVESRYADADPPTRAELDPFDPPCGDSSALALHHEELDAPEHNVTTTDNRRTATRLYAAGLAMNFVDSADQSFGDPLIESRGILAMGVDIHADPEGNFHVTVVYC